MEENSIRKDSIDWSEIRKNSKKRIKGIKTIEQSYPIIEDIIDEIGDNHSFLLTKSLEKKIQEKYRFLPKVESKVIDGDIAYIKIPSFFGEDSLSVRFASLIQNKIKSMDDTLIRGWIVDLRENSGGNMWPMYLGLAPILGEGVSGYFLDSNDNYVEWSHYKNAVYEENNLMLEIPNTYVLKNPNSKTAILIGNITASSGEAIAIAFKGKMNTSFFGEPTYGLTTGNTLFDLTDGAKLFLTTSIFVDKSKNIYGNKIIPDFLTADAKEEAIEWLKQN